MAYPVKVVYSPLSDESDPFVILAEVDDPQPVATSAPIWIATPVSPHRDAKAWSAWAED